MTSPHTARSNLMAGQEAGEWKVHWALKKGDIDWLEVRGRRTGRKYIFPGNGATPYTSFGNVRLCVVADHGNYSGSGYITPEERMYILGSHLRSNEFEFLANCAVKDFNFFGIFSQLYTAIVILVWYLARLPYKLIRKLVRR